MEWTDEGVRVVPYEPAWPSRFTAEKALLETVLAEWARGGIHHVGSTAVPGLDAKPVIDILVAVRAPGGWALAHGGNQGCPRPSVGPYRCHMRAAGGPHSGWRTRTG